MQLSQIASPRVHDLLQLNAQAVQLVCFSPPNWVRSSLTACPWVVVRRAQAPVGLIPIGVRGATRSERWAGFIPKDTIHKLVRPSQLLALAQSSALGPRTPPFLTLQQLIERWRGLALQWGPTGSLGFELATGYPATTDLSDLDIAIYAQEKIPVEQARSLWERALGLPTKVDIRVETSECGFSLEEYARAPSQILLRYPDCVQSGHDPWAKAPQVMEGAR
jgi:phosphoribosyl-dephospho-CoA transferase